MNSQTVKVLVLRKMALCLLACCIVPKVSLQVASCEILLPKSLPLDEFVQLRLSGSFDNQTSLQAGKVHAKLVIGLYFCQRRLPNSWRASCGYKDDTSALKTYERLAYWRAADLKTRRESD